MNIDLHDLCIFLNYKDQRELLNSKKGKARRLQSMKKVETWKKTAEYFRDMRLLQVNCPVSTYEGGYNILIGYLDGTPPKAVFTTRPFRHIRDICEDCGKDLDLNTSEDFLIDLDIDDKNLDKLKSGEVILIKA